MGVFKKQGVYWIDYYVNGRRKRERIGPDKRLAETVHRKRKVEIAEGKYLDKRRPMTTTFNDLVNAYRKWLGLDPASGGPPRLRSWNSYLRAAFPPLQAYFEGKRLGEITPALVEQYRACRKSTISVRRRPIATSTINRELSCLKRMFAVACKGLLVLPGGAPETNPLQHVSLEPERNIRDRVLSPEEFDRVYQAADDWLRPILLVAYQTGMRQGEIRSVRWGQVDLKQGLIRLGAEDTKNGEGRLIPLNRTLIELFKTLPRYLGCPYVFPNPGKIDAWQANPEEVDVRYDGTYISHRFARACHKVGVTNVTFHDLRHTFVTNARRAGIDYFRIMAISGHKTMLVFKRYHTIDAGDLTQAIRQMDTYMDTMANLDTQQQPARP
jgi:integrase